MQLDLKNMEMMCIQYGVSGFKVGKEAEKQSMTDILCFSRQLPPLPIWVKIGGAEDNDTLKELFHLGFHHFVAPLIETPFAVRKFIMAAKWLTHNHPEVLTLSLNMESLSAFERIDDILACADISCITKINIGKTDLADSLGHIDPNGEEVLRMAAIMIAKAKRAGKITGLGGSIDVQTITRVLSITTPHEFETRHVVFSVSKVRNPAESVRFALRLERALIEGEIKFHQFIIDELETRARSLDKRLAPAPAVLSPTGSC